MTHKQAKDALVPIDLVYMLDIDRKLDNDTMTEVRHHVHLVSFRLETHQRKYLFSDHCEMTQSVRWYINFNHIQLFSIVIKISLFFFFFFFFFDF